MSISNIFHDPIKKLFPINGYESAINRNRKMIVIYQLALGKPAREILAQLKMHKSTAVYVEPQFHLTALAVSVIMQNDCVTTYLLQQPCVNVLPQDKAGFTPLHYALILGDAKAFVTIKEAAKGKALERVNDCMGWRRFVKPKLPTPDQKVVDVLESGVRRAMTAKEFKEKTGAEFYNHVVGTRESIRELWMQRLKKEDKPLDENINQYLCRKYEEYLKKKSDLFFVPRGNESYDVCTGRPIEKLEIFSVYGGEISVNAGNRAKALQEIDASCYCNLGSLIKDGFPNVGYHAIYLKDQSKIFVAIAIRKIEKGEVLYVDFGGGHRQKCRSVTLPNRKEMEEFFRKNPLPDLMRSISEKLNIFFRDNSIELLWKLKMLTNPLVYVFHTPAALLYLYIRELLKLEDIQASYRFLRTYAFLDLELDGTEAAIGLMKEIDQYLRKCSPQQKQLCLESIDYLLQNYMYSAVMKTVKSHITENMWMKETLDLFAQAAEQFENLSAAESTKEQNVKYVHEFIRLTKQLPHEFRIELLHMMAQLIVKYPQIEEAITEIYSP